MSKKQRHILVVDDEPEVCEAIVDVLADHRVETAGTYEAAREKLSDGSYDLVILDIMGVRGHELLALHGGDYPCIMLTAHALTPEAFQKSVNGKARIFLPKEELGNLDEYVHKVLTTKTHLWGWLVKRLDFSSWFGNDWLDEDFLAGLTMEDIVEDLTARER